MKMKSFANTASAAALALSMWIAPGAVQAQPLNDRIHVNMPYKFMLGDKTLQPGDYTIQQLSDNGGGSRVLLFYTDNGMKFETSALTIPALDVNTARETKLILNQVGEDYYIDKVWVQGKDYGYVLPMPNALKSREGEKKAAATVAAQYQPAAGTKTETAQTADLDKDKDKDQKANTPPAVTAQAETKPAQNNSTAQTNTTAPSKEATQPAENPAPAATVTPQPTPEPTAAVTPQPTPAPAPMPDAHANSADRSVADQDAAHTTPAPTRMPETAANWLMMLLSGGTLTGAGVMLRRKR
jgi:hypothetical protein